MNNIILTIPEPIEPLPSPEPVEKREYTEDIVITEEEHYGS